MPDMSSQPTERVVEVVSRRDTESGEITLMVVVGDETLDIVLQPTAAMELAHSLLGFGLAEAQRRAAARSGAAAVIERAMEPQTH